MLKRHYPWIYCHDALAMHWIYSISYIVPNSISLLFVALAEILSLSVRYMFVYVCRHFITCIHGKSEEEPVSGLCFRFNTLVVEKFCSSFSNIIIQRLEFYAINFHQFRVKRKEWIGMVFCFGILNYNTLFRDNINPECFIVNLSLIVRFWSDFDPRI